MYLIKKNVIINEKSQQSEKQIKDKMKRRKLDTEKEK